MKCLTWGSSVQASFSWQYLTWLKFKEFDISAELLASPDMGSAMLSEPTHSHTSPASTLRSSACWGRTAAPLWWTVRL